MPKDQTDQKIENLLRQHYQQQRRDTFVPAYQALSERRHQPHRRSFALPAFASAAVLLLVTAVFINPLQPPPKQFAYEELEMAIENRFALAADDEWRSPTDYLLEPDDDWAQL
ncbi:MAG: hypothetical protein HKN50_00840 [Gammaproteobacteria bacterium]|nr:hypothetical protein [Gammaproteobacteria bacterium]